MIHSIKNELLICKIASVGSEIRSLINKATGQEYIWQIDETVWGSSSPVLFPAIGKIKADKIRYQCKAYDMPKHGIIRYNQDLIFNQVENHICTFTLDSSAKTLRQYPFHFSFKVVYELIDNRLMMTYHIKNNDNVEMPFICGGHTAYACPLDKKTKLSDYVIEFPKPVNLKAMTLGESGLLSGRIRDIETDSGLLSLTETLFNEDALIFSDVNFGWVRLRKRDSDKGIMVKFEDYPNLALWAKPGADYICIEPWLGLPDSEVESVDISKKSNHKRLKPNENFSIGIETIVEV